MKKLTLMMTMFLLLLAGSAAAQQEQERELTKAEKKALQEHIDSLLFVEAEQAIDAREFTLEADQVVFKYGQTAYVSSNTNFVSVKGKNAVVQVAFNIPASGFNGLGGITVDGTVSGYETKKDKKGNVHVSMNVMGIGISARVDISMTRGSNNASVTISPNFNSNRLTLNGVVLPAERSNVFKGRSL